MTEVLEQKAGFAAELECVCDARRFVRRVLVEWGLRDAEPAASVLVTELATNSVLHGRTDFEVAVTFDGEQLRLGVSDESPRAPATKTHTEHATTGRGLHLVAAYADAWGVESGPHGKTVWCVLRSKPTNLAESTFQRGETKSSQGSDATPSPRSGRPPTGSAGVMEASCRWAA